MQCLREKGTTVRSACGIAALILVATGLMPIACERVLPGPLESRLASNATADDHLVAAFLYQKESQRAQDEANKYKQAAASIRAIEDPKGFRRNALTMAAQTYQQYADEMQQLYAAHQMKAETMMGRHQPQ
ncbi:MAG TPA: hypothetical protein VKP13_04350 [Nitrospira sp.]|nr:hypothetical protein [Nitrospira sp.]